MRGKVSSSWQVKPHIVAYQMIYKIADKWRIKFRRPFDALNPFWVVAVLAVWVVGHVLVLMAVVVRISRYSAAVNVSGFPGGSCLPIEEFLVLTSVSVVVRCLLFHQNHSNLRIIITSHSKSVGNSKILDVPDTTAGYVPYLISTPVICKREGAVPRLTFCLGIMARFFSFKFGLPVLRKWFLELSLPTFAIIEYVSESNGIWGFEVLSYFEH